MAEYEQTPFSRQESKFFTELILLRNTIYNGVESVKDRLKPFPGAYRDLKLCEKLLEKIQRDISETIPNDKLRRFQQLVKVGRIYLDYPGASVKPIYILLDANELNDLAEAAIKGQCALCMREGKEIRACKLRYALLTVAPPSEVSRYGCEYRHVAGDLEAGREVSL